MLRTSDPVNASVPHQATAANIPSLLGHDLAVTIQMVAQKSCQRSGHNNSVAVGLPGKVLSVLEVGGSEE
jgi:hypothetical protein